MITVLDVDEKNGVVVIQTAEPEQVANAMGAPIIGVIYPQPDPVYGHTFKMPDLEKIGHANQTAETAPTPQY